MRRVSATSLRTRSAISMVSLLLLLLQLSYAVAANASQCATDGQLSAGAASCSPACSADGTAACLTLRASSNICSAGNVTSVTSGCPLVQSRDCLVECLPWGETTPNNAFTFYVVPQSLAPANASDWGSSVLWQNQQFVTSIGAMAMPDRIKYVSIIGGTPARALGPGVNVNVQVALSLSGANVTNLTLAGLNLGDDDPSPVSVSQSQLASLTIQNCNLTAPVDTSALPALTTLDLSQNNISAFTSDYSMESLRHLNLSNNSLTNFGAVFPALETLDLSYNNLVEIPSNVYLFSSLQTLDISANYLTNPTFSRYHYEFLNNLTSLSISGFVNSPSCKPESQQVLRAQVVCVVDTTNLVVISKSSLTWYIVIPIVATAIVSITGFSLWYHRRKKHHAKEGRRPRTWTKNTTGQLTQDDDGDSFVRFSENPHGSSAEGASSGHKYAAGSTRQPQASGSLWSDEELLAWQLRYEDIEDVEQIGMGAFAVVWLVKYRQTRQLASKRLVRDQINRQKTQDFVAEIKLNSVLDHPSIVQFVGAAWTIETDLQALFEYMPNGDLRGFLHRTRGDSSQCQWNRQKVQIAVEITEALVYVHSFTPPLVHRDLKSKNVLLGDGMKAKLSDFGVSRFASEHGTMTAGVGTGKWLAPEVLAGADYNQMCDIYSLGVVLSELDNHASPYEELKLADVALLQLVLSGDARPRFSEHCPPEIRAVADKCLAFDPANRPSAMEIAFTLRTFAKTVN